MSDAVVTRTSSRSDAAARPRVGMFVWCLGLGVMVLTGGVLSWFAYRGGIDFEQLPHLDKVVHFTLCGAVAFFLDGVLRRRAIRIGRLESPLAVPVVLVPAGIEEFLQRLSPHRTSSVGDFIADAAGVAFFVWLSRRVR